MGLLKAFQNVGACSAMRASNRALFDILNSLRLVSFYIHTNNLTIHIIHMHIFACKLPLKTIYNLKQVIDLSNFPSSSCIPKILMISKQLKTLTAFKCSVDICKRVKEIQCSNDGHKMLQNIEIMLMTILKI